MAVEFSPKAAWVSVILKELDVPISVDSKVDRISMQKAIYLAQTKGADLGYRFSWYINGPYSSSLADTYYHLDEDRTLYERYSASDDFQENLKPVKDLIAAKPREANLADWLEAVASLDFMVRVMARTLKEAVERCKKNKPHLQALFDPARVALIKFGFQEDAS